MADLVQNKSDKTIDLRAVITNYASIGPSDPMDGMLPAGVYVCKECGDASITFHQPVSKYDTKCPKCRSQMVRVAGALS